jgi:16S rRNA (cytidine1402-2'-O)-methyltransferase
MSSFSSSSAAPAPQWPALPSAASQHYPQGTLYVVATPIGNLTDITVRALHVLQLVDAIACEDTRHSARLLSAYGISRPLLTVHEHNENEAAATLIARLQKGERIAYISDAGTPGISDPGARLCAAVHQAGLRTIPLPGASSVTALLSVAGIAATPHGCAFEMTGFLPPKGRERQQAIVRLASAAHACVLLESPHRVANLFDGLSALGERLITLGRELTKQFEDVVTLPCHELPQWLAADPHRSKGEFALVLHPLPCLPAPEDVPADALRVLDLLLAELPVKTAAKLGADITGTSRNALYQAALDRQNNRR